MFRNFKRRALTKPEPIYYFWRYVANSTRTWRAMRHVPAFADTSRIAGELAEHGIVFADNSAFLTVEGQQYLASVSGQLIEKSRSREVLEIVESGSVKADLRFHPRKNYIVSLFARQEVHSPDSALVKLALDPKLLEIIAGYLGLWPRLCAVKSLLNFPTDGPAQASQMWHRDPEDLKLIKVFIYLMDVDEDRGPFSFIPKTHPFGAHSGKVPAHKDRKRVADEEMNRDFPLKPISFAPGPPIP